MSFLLFVKKIDIDGQELMNIVKKFLGKLRAASIFKSTDPIRFLSIFSVIHLYRKSQNMSI